MTEVHTEPPIKGIEKDDPFFSASFGSILSRVREVFHPWREFVGSDPAVAPVDFRYLVHAVADRGAHQFYCSDLIEEPKSISERRILSASLISPVKSVTYGNSGVILAAPPLTIKLASPVDAHIDSDFGLAGIKRQRFLYGMKAPEQLLKETKIGNYNEVGIYNSQGKDVGEGVVITGYFVKIGTTGDPLCSADRLRKISAAALHNSLPVVHIIEKYRSATGDSPFYGW